MSGDPSEHVRLLKLHRPTVRRERDALVVSGALPESLGALVVDAQSPFLAELGGREVIVASREECKAQLTGAAARLGVQLKNFCDGTFDVGARVAGHIRAVSIVGTMAYGGEFVLADELGAWS